MNNDLVSQAAAQAHAAPAEGMPVVALPIQWQLGPLEPSPIGVPALVLQIRTPAADTRYVLACTDALRLCADLKRIAKTTAAGLVLPGSP